MKGFFYGRHLLHLLFAGKNVLTQEGRALLADFDSARVISQEFITGGKMGTKGFIAPEVWKKKSFFSEANLYYCYPNK